MWPILAALGFTGYNFKTANDELSPLMSNNYRQSPNYFWSGIALGGIIGLWLGTNYGNSIKNIYSFLESAILFIIPKKPSIEGKKKDEPENKKYGLW